jgi:hypothetical protein
METVVGKRSPQRVLLHTASLSEGVDSPGILGLSVMSSEAFSAAECRFAIMLRRQKAKRKRPLSVTFETIVVRPESV